MKYFLFLLLSLFVLSSCGHIPSSGNANAGTCKNIEECMTQFRLGCESDDECMLVQDHEHWCYRDVIHKRFQDQYVDLFLAGDYPLTQRSDTNGQCKRNWKNVPYCELGACQARDFDRE